MKKHFFILFAGITLLVSCDKTETPEIEELIVAEYAVTLKEATEFAVNYINKQGDLKSAGTKKAKETKEIPTPFGSKKIFVVNLEGGGFEL